MKQTGKNLIWIDLEFTGLDFKTDHILEIATIVTDSNLNVLATGPNISIKTDSKILIEMDEWNTKHHGNSGLVKKCLDSNVSMSDAEKKTLDFLSNWTILGESPLCGNSVCSDRRMLYKNMPQLEKYLHYRNIDVSTVKILAHEWYPELAEFKKVETHTALSDIQESIEELKYYRKNIFK